jgi:hypothetical protein
LPYTLSLRSSLNVSYQVSDPYKTTGKIIVLCILIFKFLGSNLEDKRFCIEWWRAFRNLNLLLISSWIEFWSVNVVPRYLNSIELLSTFIPWLRPAFWSRDITIYLVLSAFTFVWLVLHYFISHWIR